MQQGVIEHRQGRVARWLQERRVRLAVWIALAEGVLVLVHVIPRWPAFGIALAVIALYFWVVRGARRAVVRQAGWTVAASQALVLLIPVLAFFFSVVALIAVVVLGAIAVFVLFSERRHV